MPIKKLLHVMWNDRYVSSFRVLRKSYARYKKHGWNGMLLRLEKEHNKLNLYETNNLNYKTDYEKWIEVNEKDIFKTVALKFNPLISIITPTYNTEEKYLVEMIESVLSQTYTNWELCIADDSSTNEETKKTLKKYEKRYKNIKVIFREKNGHISEASNSALSLASGEYVAFLDHDDTLAPNALYEMVKKLNTNKKLKLIYSDEDKIDEKSKRYMPHFKSGWNPDMFFSQNYICHLVLLKKEIVDKVEGLRVGYEGSQDYDLLLRCLEFIQDSEIDRVEKILYHWRAIEGSTAYGSGEKEYAHDAGQRALQDYFDKKQENIKVENGLLPNTYKVNYPIANLPLVSLLIPTRDGYDILHKCVDSILEKTIYKNYEIIVLDNETTCEKTLEYFKKIKKHKNVTILEYHYPFNYSSINNFGVKHANGEIIGLINNDVEVISKGWLSEMVSHTMRDGIGAVGAKLYYDNDTIQHAGVILGIGGVAGHSHKYFDKDAHGYFSRLKIIQNLSAVTGACLVIKKELYEEVNGLDESNLKVAFNDVDFCLKLLEKGYKNVWTPYVELYHHESISRGAEDNEKKVKRFNEEVKYMKSRWINLLKKDVYYNKNLTKEFENFGFKIEKVISMEKKIMHSIDIAQLIDGKLIIIGWIVNDTLSIEDFKLKVDTNLYDIKHNDFVKVYRKDVNKSHKKNKSELYGFILIKEIDFETKPSEITLFSNDKSFLKSKYSIKIILKDFTLEQYKLILDEYKKMKIPAIESFLKNNSLIKNTKSSNQDESIVYCIDSCVNINGNTVFLSGWAYSNESNRVTIEALESEKSYFYTEARTDIKKQKNIKDKYKHAGFFAIIEFKNSMQNQKITLKFSDEFNNCITAQVDIKNSSGAKKLSQLMLKPVEVDAEFKNKLEDIYGAELNQLWENHYNSLDIRPEIKNYGCIVENPKLSIIIPLYGRIDFLEYQTSMFLADSLFKNEVELIYVLDDPDRFYDVIDGVAKEIYRLNQVPFKLVKYKENLGYARANNIGVRFAISDMLLLLNSDIFPIKAGWTARLLDIYKTLDKPGVLGCKLLFEDDSIQHVGMSFKKETLLNDMWVNNHPHKGMPDIDKSFFVKEVPAVTGACMLIEKENYDAVGGLSENYILGDFEDSDLCLKLMKRELKIYYTNEVKLYHLERQSQSLFDDKDWKYKITLFNCWQQTLKWDKRIESTMERLNG